jgi:transposase
MPWMATDIRKARNEFVILADKGVGSFAKLCRSAGISRITGYRWLNRYRRLANINDLVELNRRPHSSPNKTSPDIENKVLEMRDRFGWGPRKLSASLKEERILLAPSTVHRILRSHRRMPIVRTDSAAWMVRILLDNNPLHVLKQEFPGNDQISGLAERIRAGRPWERRKAVAIVGCLKGVTSATIADCVSVKPRTVTRYVERYSSGGCNELFRRRKPRRVDVEGDKRLLFSLLHSPPSAYEINRTTWKLDDLHSILVRDGHRISRQRIPILIKAAGFRWRKAKVVLTSRDPEYRVKVEGIKKILSTLTENERFFSIDEFGPCAIKERGGRKRVSPGESYEVPQFQKSKGWLILTAALELSRNRITHFYSLKKNTEEMIRMVELLRAEYRNCTTLYLSWDAASWHVSQSLLSHLEKLNADARRDGHPDIRCAPLPAGSQFLNVIESVFSGMARAIVHNSDYSSVDAAKSAIDRYFEERNAHFLVYPKRAGHKIWGQERTASEFREGQNCKDPSY